MAIRDAVSADELDRHLRAVSPRCGSPASPEEAQAFDYIEEQLRGSATSVNRYASDALIGYPADGLAGGRRRPNRSRSRANGYSLSPSTGPEGVTGELVFVGAGRAADYAEQ